jgi:hypothetical protein
MKFLASYLIIALGLLVSCKTKTDFEIKDFNPFVNFTENADTLNFPMDLTDAIFDGITLPSKNQCTSGFFKISFEIINDSDKPKLFCYKIFYQNESYKFKESLNDKYNKLASNNFYGSWINAKDSFHYTPIIPNDHQYHIITDSFKIIGNPRDEEKYFGSKTKNNRLSGEIISQTIDVIRNDNVWFKKIKEKAVNNNITIEQQLIKDAIWIINKNNSKGNFNNRWKRNPYVGNYSFLLAVTSAENLSTIPEPIKDINKSINGVFINPYYYFKYDKYLLENNHIEVIESKNVLRTSAKFNLGSGLYVSETSLKNASFDTLYYSDNCCSSDKVFKNAQFEQYFHNINKNYSYKNIPVIYDVVRDNYSQNDYTKNKSKFSSKEFVNDCSKISDSPGKTVKSVTENNTLIIKNPGNPQKTYKKEDVGVNTRIGFTYGKFVAKIKFPPIINRENVWNGLTCAYWLKFQEEDEWNNRMECDLVNLGYLSKACDSHDCTRLKTTYYSEIDFEILKTSQFWPNTSYSSNANIPKDNPTENHNIIVACTNWDMACRMPKNFGVGARDFFNDGKHFTVHRWDDWYKALTIKNAINHDSIFNRPYYYEIDWQPDKIIWRIGHNRNNMMIVGYMDNTITTVPNNQMVIVFSQEFHNSEWWPLSPYIQEMIPFPKNDIQGEILELHVE